MKSIQFPNMFTRSKTNLVEDHECVAQNIKMLLYSEMGELFGDPGYGTTIKKFLYDQNDSISRDLLADSIYTAIATFMPQIKIKRKDITLTSKGNKMIITIKTINLLNFKTEKIELEMLRE